MSSGVGKRHTEPALIALGARVLGDPARAVTPWLDAHAEVFACKTGMRPVPRVLSLSLDVPWRPPPARLSVELTGGAGHVACVPCTIDGIRGFIVRTDMDDHSRTVIDIVTPVDLVQVLAVQDGDRLEVMVPRDHARNIIRARRRVGALALGLVVFVLGSLFGIIAAVASLRIAALTIFVSALVVSGVLWNGRFFRQAGMFPYSRRLRWPTWRQ